MKDKLINLIGRNVRVLNEKTPNYRGIELDLFRELHAQEDDGFIRDEFSVSWETHDGTKSITFDAIRDVANVERAPSGMWEITLDIS